jgi:hypothetical protein
VLERVLREVTPLDSGLRAVWHEIDWDALIAECDDDIEEGYE